MHAKELILQLLNFPLPEVFNKGRGTMRWVFWQAPENMRRMDHARTCSRKARLKTVEVRGDDDQIKAKSVWREEKVSIQGIFK